MANNPVTPETPDTKEEPMIERSFTVSLIETRGLTVTATYRISAVDQHTLDTWVNSLLQQAQEASRLQEAAAFSTMPSHGGKE